MIVGSAINRYFENWSEKKQIVTLFMLTYKRPNYVKLAIESVLRQTFSNFYLIVLDNISKDSTKDVVCSFKDERVIYVERESNANICPTNTGFAFEICKTKYLAVLHDDDILEPTYLEEVLHSMETNPSYSVTTVMVNTIDEKGDIIIRNRPNESGPICYSKTDYFVKKFSFDNTFPLCFPTAMYRKSFYSNWLVFFNPQAGPAVDQYVWFQTERYGGTICLLTKALFNYRVHKNSDSNYYAGTMGLVLLNYLYEDNYYRNLMIINKKSIKLWIRHAWKKSLLGFYRKEFDKTEIKKAYRLVSKKLLITFGARLEHFVFLLISLFPRLFALGLRLKYYVERER